MKVCVWVVGPGGWALLQAEVRWLLTFGVLSALRVSGTAFVCTWSSVNECRQPRCAGCDSQKVGAWWASEETRGSSSCRIPGLHRWSVASACSQWKGCEVLHFTCHLTLSLVGKHRRINTGMVSCGPSAGLVLDPSEICGFLVSPEVSLIHQQKEHDTVLLLEEASCHLRNVAGVFLCVCGANTGNG